MTSFNSPSLEILRKFATEGPPGNRWFKVNLHAHGEGSTAADVVAAARDAQLDLIAITDHQTFDCYDAIHKAAVTKGRSLTVLPGIEITTHEGAHLLAVFPATYSKQQCEQLLGWLELPGSGDTNIASRRTVLEVLNKVENEERGIIIVPHPFAPKTGLLDSSRKISTKLEWLESGHIRLFQVSEEMLTKKIRFIERNDDGNWVNRFVLNSANEKQIAESSYCLAPFNRSDAHDAEDIAEGCSWFRMQDPSVEGLKQVTCEPKTRISWTEPDQAPHDAILAVRADSGYCCGEIFQFNHALNCLVGSNYAGKSTVLDLVRFALNHERSVRKEIREKLLTRLYGTLGADGNVELFVRKGDDFYVLRRTLDPAVVERSGETVVTESMQPFAAYRYDNNKLVPDEDFDFSIEVYEQGRINRLRDDLPRQLDMLDEFAQLDDLKGRRSALVTKLDESAQHLYLLYEEREQLKSDLAALPELKEELKEKEKLLPEEKEEQRWANAAAFAEENELVVDVLAKFRDRLAEPDEEQTFANEDDIEQLFGQIAPDLAEDNVVEADLLAKWRKATTMALDEIDQARKTVVVSIDKLITASGKIKVQWIKKRDTHDQAVSKQLSAAGVESPAEIIRLVSELRSNVNNLVKRREPRLEEVEQHIKRAEDNREKLIRALADCDQEITAKRDQKSKELTEALGEHIRIELDQAVDRTEYAKVLAQLVKKISTTGHQIKSREGQLRNIVKNVRPLELAAALAAGGNLLDADGESTTLTACCGITENTQNVLCRMADNIKLLNHLAVVIVPDVLRIKVRRRGEDKFADLRTGLSPGEQSAAILTLALETRSTPLILDQPEDELGYSYVVHLIVPKMLEAKFSRQILTVTHNANIPVLGDADFIIKMENQPDKEQGRRCVPAETGCFESPAITDALIELEGGTRAFQFRQHRYTLPRYAPSRTKRDLN